MITKNNVKSKNSKATNKQKLLPVLTEKEIDIIKHLNDCTNRDLALFLYYTGMRISEALSLNVSSVKGKKYIEVIGKRNKQRLIPLSENVLSIINNLTEDKEDNRPLFETKRNVRMSRTTAWREINRLKDSIDNEHTRLSPHTLRHTFATVAMRKGVNVKHISTALGHSSVATTLNVYQHSTLEDLNFVNQL